MHESGECGQRRVGGGGTARTPYVGTLACTLLEGGVHGVGDAAGHEPALLLMEGRPQAQDLGARLALELFQLKDVVELVRREPQAAGSAPSFRDHQARGAHGRPTVGGAVLGLDVPEVVGRAGWGAAALIAATLALYSSSVATPALRSARGPRWRVGSGRGRLGKGRGWGLGKGRGWGWGCGRNVLGELALQQVGVLALQPCPRLGRRLRERVHQLLDPRGAFWVRMNAHTRSSDTRGRTGGLWVLGVPPVARSTPLAVCTERAWTPPARLSIRNSVRDAAIGAALRSSSVGDEKGSGAEVGAEVLL